MRVRTIEERLNMIEDTILNDPFFSNTSISSGNGGYIFDYGPEDELKVRNFVENNRNRTDLGFRIQVIDLFNDVMVRCLEEQGYLDSVFELEEECRDNPEGIEYLKNTLYGVFQQGSANDIFVNYLEEHAQPGNVIFLIGVGKCHPFVRSHMIINNFDSKAHGVKTILFYPGIYDCETLKLFGTIPSENYYRSMVLIGRTE